MLSNLKNINLNYNQSLCVGAITFVQSFIETSMPLLQWFGAALGVMVLIKKLLSKDAK